MRKNTQKSKGIAAIAALATIYGITAVLARYLSEGVGLYEQWYLRYGVATIFAYVMFRKHINFKKIAALPAKEWWVVGFRVIIGSVAAVALYTVAAQKSKIGPVAFMQVVPIMAVLSVLFFGEKLSLRKALVILLSFVGAASVAVSGSVGSLSIDYGAILSLISGGLFALALLTRKWHAKLLNNYEIAFLMVAGGAIANYLISLVLYQRWLVDTTIFDAEYTAPLLFAGSLSVFIHFLANYGFERIGGLLAGVILNLELVFGPIFGYIFFSETLGIRELVGGLIILLAISTMAVIENAENKSLRTNT